MNRFMNDALTVLDKYDRFRFGKISRIQTQDKTVRVTLAVGNDEGDYTDTLLLVFHEVVASKLFAPHMLDFLDLSEGVTLLFEHDQVGFAPGVASSMHYMHSAPFYIVASNITYKELTT